MTLDWLDPSRAQFLRLSANLPHALLIHGETGVGKNVLAMEIVAGLLCDQPIRGTDSLQACGQCKHCVLFQSNNHPDFHYLASEWWVKHSDSAHLMYAERYLEDQSKRQKRKPRQVIAVDQIRTLIDDFSLSHHSAEHKVALIQPAEAMNTNAANALLKLLEEPNPDSILILVSSDISALPMTIRSRCIAITVHKPSPDKVISWLQAQQVDDETAHKALALSAGAPFTALSYSQSEDIQNFENGLSVLSQVLHQQLDPIQAREALIKSAAPKVILSWLQLIISWLVELTSMSVEEQQRAIWQAYGPELSNITRGFDQPRVPQLFKLYEDLLQIKQQDVDIINLSLAIDKWLIAFTQRLTVKRL